MSVGEVMNFPDDVEEWLTAIQWAEKVEICMRQLDVNELRPQSVTDHLAQFNAIAKVIREALAAEREACAKIAEDRMKKCGRSDCFCGDGFHVAAAIRARGET